MKNLIEVRIRYVLSGHIEMAKDAVAWEFQRPPNLTGEHFEAACVDIEIVDKPPDSVREEGSDA